MMPDATTGRSPSPRGCSAPRPTRDDHGSSWPPRSGGVSAPSRRAIRSRSGSSPIVIGVQTSAIPISTSRSASGRVAARHGVRGQRPLDAPAHAAADAAVGREQHAQRHPRLRAGEAPRRSVGAGEHREATYGGLQARDPRAAGLLLGPAPRDVGQVADDLAQELLAVPEPAVQGRPPRRGPARCAGRRPARSAGRAPAPGERRPPAPGGGRPAGPARAPSRGAPDAGRVPATGTRGGLRLVQAQVQGEPSLGRRQPVRAPRGARVMVGHEDRQPPSASRRSPGVRSPIAKRWRGLSWNRTRAS